MGNPKNDSPSSPRRILNTGSSDISLHDTTTTTTPSEEVESATANPRFQRYFDDDPEEIHDDDLPPLYSDLDDGGGGVTTTTTTRTSRIDPLIPNNTPELSITPFNRTSRTDTINYMDQRLETDPSFLKSQLEILAVMPPRSFVHIRGHHRETHRNGDKTETKEVVDFALEIELTSLLFTDARTQSSWKSLTTVSNFEKVRRGTVFQKRAPGFGGSGSVAEEGEPGVLEWCHRFCASSAGLKVFSFERRVIGWDYDLVRTKLENLVRGTNYRGHLNITFPIHNSRVDIYNDCRTNRWRLTNWIAMIFMFTLTFIFTWPWLFFRTVRFETVCAVWPMSRDGRYASMSEERWYNMWARTIQKAVLKRRQGVLDRGDIQRAEAVEEQLNGFAGTVQAGLNAMDVVNQSFGWGADSDGHSIGNFGRVVTGTGSRRC